MLLSEDADVERYVREIVRVRSSELLPLPPTLPGFGSHPAIHQLLAETGITAWRERARATLGVLLCNLTIVDDHGYLVHAHETR